MDYNEKYNRGKRKAEYNRRWRLKNKEKAHAHNMYHAALRRGEIKVPDRCEFCERKLPLEAHHEDYKNQLDVQHLCNECHNLVERIFKWTL